MEAILLIGIPASGKSTFCARFSETHVRINLDTLRSRDREQRLVEQCLADRQSFVVDNTNLLAFDRARYIPAAKDAGYRVTGYVFVCDVDDAIARNARRQGRACVPEHVIHRMRKQFEPPAMQEGFDALFRVTTAKNTFEIANASV